MYYELLRAKIEDGSAVCGVVGLGYVGLPLAVEMGNVNLNVLGLDVSKRVVNDLNAGRSHIKDIPSSDVARLVANRHPGETITFEIIRDGKHANVELTLGSRPG